MPELALPSSPDVEKLVLGVMLTDADALPALRPVVTANYFSTESHQRILNAIWSLYDAGSPVDRITTVQALRERGELESVGGLGFIVSLDDDLPRIPNPSAYVSILGEQDTRRRIMQFADSLMRRAANGEKPQSILDTIGEGSLTLIRSDRGDGLISARELVEREGLTKILAPRVERGVPFPWEWLNSVTGGMVPGELWILAAHASAGKSSAAIQASIHVARHQPKSVAIFSLEMADVSVFQRAVWQVSRVDSERAKRGILDSAERRRAADAVGMLRELPLYFDDAAFSVMEIHARLRGLRSRGPIGLIVVDYLQLLRDGARHSTRAEAVGANARALKLMAGEFECPVLLLSQFNRDSAKTKGNEAPRRPELYDLKESGDIENHANGVWFIHRPSHADSDRIPVEFILPKQRDGRRNILQEYDFFPKYQRFDAKGSDE